MLCIDILISVSFIAIMKYMENMVSDCRYMIIIVGNAIFSFIQKLFQVLSPFDNCKIYGHNASYIRANTVINVMCLIILPCSRTLLH